MLIIVSLLWAGALLGGSFIAAPAKFRVESLDLAQLLAVGQAQFQALALTEVVLASCMIVTTIWARPAMWYLILIPLAIFALQQSVIYPPLDARTAARIAGEPVSESNLHLVYVALEAAKFLSLIVVAAFCRMSKDRIIA
ncbi:MAG: hypothetical protein AAGH70_11520 [Pseudomonadota bacterium]